MPRVQLKTLTEQMYYVLLALQDVRYGSEISQYVKELTNQRIQLGPGTLYAILSKFEEEQLIEILKANKGAIGWSISDLKGISPTYCMHKIFMEYDYRPSAQP